MLDQLLPILNNVDAKSAKYIDDNGVPLACREGCDYCCYLRVDTFPHEAFSIAEYIRENFTDKQIDELMGRLKQHVEIRDC